MTLFELSGEDRALAVLEIRSLLETHRRKCSIVREHRTGIVLDGLDNLAPALARRLAFTRRIAVVSDEKSIGRIGTLKVDIGAKRFAIVPRKVDRVSYSMQDVVVKLGASLLAKNPGSKVDLRKPDVRVELFGAEHRLYASTEVHEVDRKALESRTPKLRPMRSPVGMHPRLARAMVNLARVQKSDVVLDPFCGTGGTLFEASQMGMRAIGMDIEEKMVIASKENLRYFGLKGTVVHGDALELADALERARAKRVDAMVSDLPYGRSTTLAGRKLQELITKFVAQAEKVLGPGRFMVLCINDGRLVERAIRGTPFKVMEKFERRVHKSLTRHFFVIKKGSRK